MKHSGDARKDRGRRQAGGCQILDRPGVVRLVRWGCRDDGLDLDRLPVQPFDEDYGRGTAAVELDDPTLDQACRLNRAQEALQLDELLAARS